MEAMPGSSSSLYDEYEAAGLNSALVSSAVKREFLSRRMSEGVRVYGGLAEAHRMMEEDPHSGNFFQRTHFFVKV
eukprot:CAMPEP_0114169484 /NCGR_PEP_ID=MMETSP0043_2-20121206/33586_1 /TAXON_ID=464988 /ORGANISM="Hemiselmis andersenii, Strain CCMP644" /LENGTH=74 /DNA_ID=CAMNT_0001266935 /DNA_START=72 /DNA_END=293 /DNA_ORIENTATION=+